ncbi:MAG: 8-oxo-dGTP diphosphatase [Chloroflexota bacterium]|jgi:diadenosine hexaphosphate hydrolase (ATP-forming)|nr:8-oxo-dGTP diphosphatase [Chloroflexota bacterium]
MAAVQAGGIIVWRDRVILRRTLLGEWVFPKGWIDPGETPEQAAIREVREETGVRAEVVRDVGIAPYEAEGEAREVAFYLMRVVDSPEWPEHAGADAATFPVGEIARVLTFQNNRDLWARVADDVQELIRKRRGWSWSER